MVPVHSVLERTIAQQRSLLSRGLWILPTSARLLPALAMFETVRILVYAFRGSGSEKTSLMIAVTNDCANACIPLLAGLTAAALFQAGHIYFDAQLEDMVREMRS